MRDATEVTRVTYTPETVTLTMSVEEARAMCAIYGALNGDVFVQGDVCEPYEALAAFFESRGEEVDSRNIPVHSDCVRGETK